MPDVLFLQKYEFIVDHLNECLFKDFWAAVCGGKKLDPQEYATKKNSPN